MTFIKTPLRLSLFALGLFVVVALSTGALAHTKLEKSEPAAGASLTDAPKQIQLWFNEKIDPALSKVTMTSPAGPVELVNVHQMGEKSLMAGVKTTLTAGAYTVHWQTAGADGHVVKGDFTFTVKTTH